MFTFETTRFGAIKIQDTDQIHLTKGLIGFKEEKEFVLVPSSKNALLAFLQSLKTPDLAFVVINPYDFYSSYDFDLHDDDVADLSIQAPEDVIVLTLVVVPPELSKISTNLLAPIIINKHTRQGKQLVLKNSTYQVKHYFLHDLNRVLKSRRQKSLD